MTGRRMMINSSNGRLGRYQQHLDIVFAVEVDSSRALV